MIGAPNQDPLSQPVQMSVTVGDKMRLVQSRFLQRVIVDPQQLRVISLYHWILNKRGKHVNDVTPRICSANSIFVILSLRPSK